MTGRFQVDVDAYLQALGSIEQSTFPKECLIPAIRRQFGF